MQSFARFRLTTQEHQGIFQGQRFSKSPPFWQRLRDEIISLTKQTRPSECKTHSVHKKGSDFLKDKITIGQKNRVAEISSKDDSSKENWSRKIGRKIIGRAENWSKDNWSSGKLVERLLVEREIGRRIIGRAENWSSSGRLVKGKLVGGKLVEKK